MKKVLSLILMLLLAVTAFVGCANPSDALPPMSSSETGLAESDNAESDELETGANVDNGIEENIATTNQHVQEHETPVPPPPSVEFIMIRGIRISTSLTELNLTRGGWFYSELTDLDIVPLQYMTNLTNLHLSRHNIRDFTPLSGLMNLRVLSLESGNIRDISSLAGLTGLEQLHLRDNFISDISSLVGLTNLETLALSNNQIRDISPLAGLTGLERLYLWNNQISDISPLADLMNLRTLWLDNNHIFDRTPVDHISFVVW